MRNGFVWRTVRWRRVIRAADAKEVGVGNPAEETYRHPNQNLGQNKIEGGFVKMDVRGNRGDSAVIANGWQASDCGNTRTKEWHEGDVLRPTLSVG